MFVSISATQKDVAGDKPQEENVHTGDNKIRGKHVLKGSKTTRMGIFIPGAETPLWCGQADVKRLTATVL